MKHILLLLPLLVLSACTHTINLRANHFATPIVGDNQWSGHVAMVGTASTSVTVINDITSNPPSRTTLVINKDITAADLFLINNLGIDASLSVAKSLELYVDSSLLGLRWQLLNHGASTDAWAMAVQGGLGSSSKTTAEGTNPVSSATSKVSTTQAGLSIGYKTAQVVPYISYVHETYEIATSVTNSGGSFGPYTDKGAHDYYSVGISTHGKGFRGAIEYSMININWDRATQQNYQNAVGVKVGGAW
jgi:hypothetical protein